MKRADTSYPVRLLLCIAVFAIALGMVLSSIFMGDSAPQAEMIPVMSKPSVFYQLGKMLDFQDEHTRQLHRDSWQGSYEIDAVKADPELSAWASGSYQVAGPGVDPNAIGKLSDQELMLFRWDLQDRADHDWQYAPPDIRRKYERMYDTQSYKGLPQ